MKEKQFMNFFLISFLFLIQIELATANTPMDQEGEGFESQTILRNKINKRNSLSLTLTHKEFLDERKPFSVRLDYQYSFNKYLSTYIGHDRVTGELFNEDWIKPASGVWMWENTSNRAVDYSLLGIKPRTQLSFLPGKAWLFQLDIELKHNHFNQQQTLTFLPELKYFQYRDGKPFITYFYRHQSSQGMNFGDNRIYRKYDYLGFLYHANKFVAFGPFVGISSYKWFSTPEIESMINKEYEVENKSQLAGFVVSNRF